MFSIEYRIASHFHITHIEYYERIRLAKEFRLYLALRFPLSLTIYLLLDARSGLYNLKERSIWERHFARSGKKNGGMEALLRH